MATLRKCISGGQTGADKTGLVCAKAIGLETGGTAPKGWRTDEGPDLTLQDYGLVESKEYRYDVRTRENVRDADVTLWFGRTSSPGYYCTQNACRIEEKPFYVNPTDAQLEYICNTYEVANIAGNRRRLNPAVVHIVQGAFRVIAECLGKPEPNF